MTKEQLLALGLTEELAKKAAEASQEELKGYIPKTRFDEVNEAKKQLETDIKDRDKQLKELGEKSKGNEELTKQIAELQEANKKTAGEYEGKIKQMQFDHTLDGALKAANVKNVKAIKALLNLETIKLDGETLTGLNDQIEGLKKSDAYLFDEVEPDGTGGSKGNGGKGKPGAKNPWAKDSFNLTEQGRLLRENPDLAKQYMQAAGK